MNQLRIFLVILASCFLLPADAKGGNAKDVAAVNDSLLRVLDKAVANSKALRERHEERINALRTTYGNTSSWSVRYDIVTRQTSANASSWSNTSGRGSSGRPCSP